MPEILRCRVVHSSAHRSAVHRAGNGPAMDDDAIRLGHEWNADRWADLDRDIDGAVAGDLTLRVGWRQVLDPCRMAAAVARVLLARGWAGQPRGCRPGCPVNDIGGSPAPGAGDPPMSLR